MGDIYIYTGSQVPASSSQSDAARALVNPSSNKPSIWYSIKQ